MRKNLFLIIASIIIVLDQITKFIFREFFNVEKNFGAAFNLFPGQRWLFILMAIIVISLIFTYVKKIEGYGEIGLGFLLGGAVGNLIDRVFLGYVVDFISIGIFPSFNLADYFNVIGGLILAIYLIKKKIKF